ncbi:MAG: TetR/AcrR family transcriptional regulator [Verrucomicrobiae bacterium]|nr:TetR/AcrR family transcriptional regulator [Verrucomicrobiae bacterium]
MARTSDDTRQRLLEAARSIFAHHGYEGASVAAIALRARVTKPALYYHFGSKANLYEALVVETLDDRWRLMRAAAAQGNSLEERLTGVIEACFRHAREHREGTRICFSALFAAPDEVPRRASFMRRGRRNFEFVAQLLREGARRGELRRDLNVRELAAAIYSRVVANSLAEIIQGSSAPPANARSAVRIFLQGAAADPRERGRRRRAAAPTPALCRTPGPARLAKRPVVF